MTKGPVLAVLLFAPLWGCELAKRQSLEAAFIAACEAGNTPRVREMLVQDGSLVRAEARFRKGGGRQRPLNAAAARGHLEVAKLLLDRGADIHATTYSRQTALHEAAATGRAEIVQLLLAKGADVNARHARDGTPLHAAASNNDPEVAALLIEKGARGRAIDELLRASQSGDTRGLEQALASGVSLDATGAGGFTPLMVARDAATVRHLVARGAGANVSDEYGVTPLMQAASAGKLDVVRALLEVGASRQAQTRSGRTALHEARDAGHQEVVKILEAAGR